jgi:hypothetical protein
MLRLPQPLAGKIGGKKSYLENHLGSELEVTRPVCHLDSPEIRIAQRQNGRTEIRCIGYVKRFGPERKADAFAKPEALERGEIEVDSSRLFQDVSSRVAIGIRSICNECIRIEPAVERSIRSGERRVANNVGTVGIPRIRGIAGLSGAEGAVIDPLAGDFLFSTFGDGDRVVRVEGFAAPPQPPSGIAEPSTAITVVSALGSCSDRKDQVLDLTTYPKTHSSD